MRTAFVMTFLALASIALGQDNYLIKDGQTDYTIVIPDKAIPSEITASKEIQTYLKQIAGVDLKVVKASDYESGSMIAVGFNDKLPASLQVAKYGTLGEEELIIDSDGKTLLLAGGRPRGTLYAVYEYLDQLGVRWYTPRYTKVPKLKNIALPQKAFRYNPPLTLRSYLQNNSPTKQWTARNRMNQYIVWQDPGQAYGGGHAQGPDMHTFRHFVKAKELDEHPEWIGEWGGQRAKPDPYGAGLCLSNTELRRFLIDKTMDYARKNPHKKSIWIGHNDTKYYCTCKKCKQFYSKHGGRPSSLVIQLLNELADEMKKEMPDRMVKTFAYWWSQEPPTNMKVRDNAILMFCAPVSCFIPIETGTTEGIRKTRVLAKAWKQLARNLEVYLYQFPTGNYWYPTPNLHKTAADIRWAEKSKIPNVYVQLCGCGTGDGSELVHLRAWIYARILWNPSLDVQTLIEEFVNDYYGPAADTVLTAIRLTHSNLFDKRGKFIKYNKSEVAPQYLNPTVIRQINEMIEKKLDTLTDEVYKKRLRYVWLPYLYADVQLGYTKDGTYDARKDAWSFPMEDGELRLRYAKLVVEIMKENNVSAFAEWIRLTPADINIGRLFGKKK